MNATRSATFALVTLCVLLWSTSAFAQRLGGHRFVPAGSEDGVLETEGADARVPFRPYVSAWLHYANDPVVVVDGNDESLGAVVADQFSLDVAASMTVWKGLELGFGLPVFIVASGDDAALAATGLNEPGFSLGDLTLRLGYRFRIADHTAFALHVPVLLPTSADDNVLGLGFGVKPTAAFMQRFGSLEMFLNLSFLIRAAEQALDFDGGSELGFRLGLRYALDRAWKTNAIFDVGITTSTNDFFGAPTTPIEPRAGLEWWFAESWRLTGFGGIGVTGGVGAPDFRVGMGISYGDNPTYRPRPAPTDDDRDGDGVPNDEDQCPDEVEDRDEFEDDDGCPDPDNDGDGVDDIDDQCPTAPETANGISDEDGCPDKIRLDDTRITTFERVYFKTGSDEIDPRSHEMLDEVGAILKVNPDLEIRVEGHTDSRGNAETNMRLSQERADSVRDYLTSRGARGGQVEAKGYGQTRPIASNETEEGRAQNRRVEFHIVQEEE